MPRSINNVDLHILILDGRVFGQDGNAALPLQIPGIHDTVHDLLVLPVHAALFQHLIHQSGLAVVDVGDNCDISQMFVLQSESPFLG